MYAATVATMNDKGIDLNLDPSHPIHLFLSTHAMNATIGPLSYNTPNRWQEAITFYDSLVRRRINSKTAATDLR